MRSSKCYPEQITLGFVEVKEDSTTVVGKEKPIDWVILTSHPVKSLEDALRILSWYQDRWTIEQAFRTIKLKGLDIENTRYEKFHGLQNLVTIALIAATQIMQLRHAWSGVTQETMEDVLLKEEQQVIKGLNTKLEGKTDKLKNPHPEKSLAYASWLIARLGGWSGYHSSSKPGPITFMEGMSQFCTIMRGYYLAIEDP